MHPEQMELLRNVDHRVGRIEQILPTLVTKADLQAAIEPLATKAELRVFEIELRAAISESEQRMRTHFDVVTESLRDDIQLIATGLGSFSQRER